MNLFALITDYLQERENLGIKPGLQRMQILLKRLKRPDKQYPIVHVTGTNGKGSTVQMVANSLIYNGYHVGVFTSPSFHGYRGHFFINNEMIDELTFVQLMAEIIPIVYELDEEDNAPTTFEILTALAFLYFHGRVDVAIIEAGMGGRFDTTNCITPLVSVITSVAKDHEQFLGSTLEEISYHKAGIIKQNQPVVIGPIPDEALHVIVKEAKEKNSKLYRYGEEFNVTIQNRKGYWSLQNKSFTFSLQLEGQHQYENAGVAITVVNMIQHYFEADLDWNKVQKALKELTMPGRFEKVTKSPNIIVDSAHNMAAIEAFIATAKRYFNGKPKRILFAGFKDKSLIEMIKRLRKENVQITLTTFDHERAASKDYFKDILDEIPFVEDWQSEIFSYLENGSPREHFFVTGSLHFTMIVRNFIIQLNENKKLH